MAILIPIKDDPNHDFNIELESKLYNFAFNYNDEFNYWAMNISDDAGNILLAGYKLVANFYILKPFNNVALPKGELFVEVAARNLDITRNVFKDGLAKLIYFTSDEVKAL